jgi:hypothetical protein
MHRAVLPGGAFGPWRPDSIANDVHRLDLGSLVWTLLAAAGAAGAPSTPRLFFGFAAAPDRLFVFGGSGDLQVAPHLRIFELTMLQQCTTML